MGVDYYFSLVSIKKINIVIIIYNTQSTFFYKSFNAKNSALIKLINKIPIYYNKIKSTINIFYNFNHF